MYDHERLRIANNLCGMLQNDEEILWAIRRAKEHIVHSARYFMEIGCKGGGSLVMWSSIMHDCGLMLGVTLDDECDALQHKVNALTGINTRIINADSHFQSTKNAIAKQLGKEKLSGLFIDGDHSYNGALDDFNMYKEFVMSPGFIAFHDIMPGNNEDKDCGHLFQHMKYHYSYEEKRVPNMWRGIGIILL